MKKTEKKVNDKDFDLSKDVKPKAIKPKTSNSKFKKEKHELLMDVQIGDELVKKGTMYPLTDEGVKYFKSKFYIK